MPDKEVYLVLCILLYWAVCILTQLLESSAVICCAFCMTFGKMFSHSPLVMQLTLHMSMCWSWMGRMGRTLPPYPQNNIAILNLPLFPLKTKFLILGFQNISPEQISKFSWTLPFSWNSAALDDGEVKSEALLIPSNSTVFCREN